MRVFYLLIILAAVTGGSMGFYFSLGGQLQGDQQWQDFDNQENNHYEERYSYHQNPNYHQYVNFHQSYPHGGETLTPSQTLTQATQHLLQPAQHLLQAGQHLFHNQQQNQYTESNEQQVYQSPVHVVPSYQFVNRFQNSPLTPHNSVPVVVRLVENQSLLPPIRAVYALPPFLEKLVQRIQGYYSVYNTPEQLTLDRPLFRPTVTPTTNGIQNIVTTELVDNNDNPAIISSPSPFVESTSQSISSSTENQKVKPSTDLVETSSKIPEQTISSTSTTTSNSDKVSTTTIVTAGQVSNSPTISVSTTGKVSTLAVFEVTPTTKVNEVETTTISTEMTTDEQTEQTTDPSNYITPDTMQPDMQA